MALATFARRVRWDRSRPYVLAALIALVATGISWAFAVTVLRATRPMGLPLDDSYIYLTYAKQFGRGEPFSYFSGGGYSAGSTSVVWPMVLAPFWTLGARGHALVWVSYVLCTALYVATAIGVWRVVRKVSGELAGVLGALALLGIAPFAWTSLSGMEVAFASALLLATILLLIRQSPDGPPGKRLSLCLAALSLSRPEATLLVIVIVGVAVLNRLWRRDLRAAAWWLVPLAAPLAWVIANKLLAGNFFPNTGIAKSYFYLPGFDWAYWKSTVWSTSWAMLKGLFWESTSPLIWPRLVAAAWLIGAVRVVLWARRAQRILVGVLIVLSPFVLLFAVVATSGLWSFQNYRYIAPAFPLLMIPVGAALGPWHTWSRWGSSRQGSAAVVGFADLVVVFFAQRAVVTLGFVGLCAAVSAIGGVAVIACMLAVVLELAPVVPLAVAVLVGVLAPFRSLAWARWAHSGAAVVLVVLFGQAAKPGLVGDARLFAQGALDTNTQVVTLGHYIHDKLPGASVMFHDAGAIAYYGDSRIYDMLGLVTNHQALVANHGPGARFEMLENLPVDQRPTHFAYYPTWLGTDELYGEVLLQTPLRGSVKGLTKKPFVGDSDMQLIVANFDHVGTGEEPLRDHPGWRMVDRLDIADLASEAAHEWKGELGRRNTLDPTARWSVVGRDVGPRGLVLDGGRTIRNRLATPPNERFTIAVDASKPTRLVLRTGGQVSYSYHEAIGKPVTLHLLDDEGHVLGERTLAVPDGRFVEHVFDVPAGVSRIRTQATAPYRVFHWFVLQPD